MGAEVLMEFSGKSYVKLNKLISLQKAKGSNQEPVQPPNSSSVVKDYRSEVVHGSLHKLFYYVLSY